MHICVNPFSLILNFYCHRDVRDYKSRIDAYSREMLRKEAQIKDLQTRVDNGDGSKLFVAFFILYCSQYFVRKIRHHFYRFTYILWKDIVG